MGGVGWWRGGDRGMEGGRAGVKVRKQVKGNEEDEKEMRRSEIIDRRRREKEEHREGREQVGTEIKRIENRKRTGREERKGGKGLLQYLIPRSLFNLFFKVLSPS